MRQSLFCRGATGGARFGICMIYCPVCWKNYPNP